MKKKLYAFLLVVVLTLSSSLVCFASETDTVQKDSMEITSDKLSENAKRLLEEANIDYENVSSVSITKGTSSGQAKTKSGTEETFNTLQLKRVLEDGLVEVENVVFLDDSENIVPAAASDFSLISPSIKYFNDGDYVLAAKCSYYLYTDGFNTYINPYMVAVKYTLGTEISNISADLVANGVKAYQSNFQDVDQTLVNATKSVSQNNPAYGTYYYSSQSKWSTTYCVRIFSDFYGPGLSMYVSYTAAAGSGSMTFTYF